MGGPVVQGPLADVGLTGLEGQDQLVVVQVVVTVGITPELRLRQGGVVAAAVVLLGLVLAMLAAILLNMRELNIRHVSQLVLITLSLALDWKEFDLCMGASGLSSSMISDLVMALELSSDNFFCLLTVVLLVLLLAEDTFLLLLGLAAALRGS